jgi:hypothetical protein
MVVLAVALLVGTAAAFTYTEKLKLERKPIAKARVDRLLLPGCDCRRETARIRFELRDAGPVRVTIVNGDGDHVRLLEAGLRGPRERVVLRWDGRDDAGSLVPDGSYRVRLRLLDERRTIQIPDGIRVGPAQR